MASLVTLTRCPVYTNIVRQQIAGSCHYSLRLSRVCCFASWPGTKKDESRQESDIMRKLIYSSKHESNKNWDRILRMREKAKMKNALKKWANESISLKFLDASQEEKVITLDDQLDYEISPDHSTKPVMPMGLKVASSDCIKAEEAADDALNDDASAVTCEIPVDGSTKTTRKYWSNDYVKYTHSLEETEPDSNWALQYGSNNPKIPQSHVPCGGCGAHLHCQNKSIPGFIPQEVFKVSKPEMLRGMVCQRCYFLQNHDMALSIAVDQEVYPKIISHIKKKNALVLLAVDVTDFPCSIWPGITDLVGLNCPMFLVGNKVDLIWGDGKGWMLNVERSMRSFFPRKANIIGSQLISAKTGFGVEDLISKLHSAWQYNGDVYLVGCTNVGKSTLFNALLQSDYCKVKAADLVQRATVSPWPGTTLNLLKFPILRPEGWRIYLRSKRLKEQRTQILEEKLRRDGLRRQSKLIEPPQLIGHIGRTFHQGLRTETEDSFAAPEFEGRREPVPGSGLNPNNPEYAKGRWFYDTPGVLHRDQILDLLTTEELMKVLPQKIIEPRVFIVKPGWTLFVGGLARVDYVHGNRSTKWVVFVSRDIPITICFTEDADEVYDKLLGTDILSVPTGDAERLKKWPALKHKDTYKFSGLSLMECCGDIVLSSCGWISFTAGSKEVFAVRPWTPDARGIYTRTPSLLPFIINLKTSLTKGTPAYSKVRVYDA